MPLPLAPLLPIALRLGTVAAASYAVTRWVRSRTQVGRTDQRAEDALDDLGEGLAVHRPADRAAAGSGDGQTNASARLRRVIRFRGQTWEIDASASGRVRLRQRDDE